MTFPLNARVAVSVALKYLDNSNLEQRYLVCLSSRRETWEFPGGKLEPGETLYEAICREVKEELGEKAFDGISISDSVVSIYSNPTDDGNTFVFVLFKGMIFRQNFPIELTEHTECRLATKQEMLELNLAPRLHEWVMSGRENYHRDVPHIDVTDTSLYGWYPGEKPEVGKDIKNDD